MKIEELADREAGLYLRVLELYKKPRTDDSELQEIFSQYRLIHQQYADLALSDDEALKRGLFIQWYALTEPNYLTGIGELDRQAEIKIINTLDKKLQQASIDNELKWMLDYYMDWEWVFEQFEAFSFLEEAMLNRDDKLPESINREVMKQRGQMGNYWNSLTCFKNNDK